MAGTRELREVDFRLLLGDLKPLSVNLVMYDPLKDQTCQYSLKKQRKTWVLNVSIPKWFSQYHYEVTIGAKSNYSLIKKAKKLKTNADEFVSSPTPYCESSFRKLPDLIKTCRDVFEPPDGSDLISASIFEGLTNNHLQNLVDSVKSVNDLKRSLVELEHLSRVFNTKLLESKESSKVRSWIGKPFVTNSKSHHTLVLLSALFGRLAIYLDLHIRDLPHIPASLYGHILKALENVESCELTQWSIERLRVTSIQTLEKSKKDHWIYAAAFFPHLFELNQLMALSKSKNKTTLRQNELRTVIIPRVKSGYNNKDAVTAILHNLVKTATSVEQKAEIAEVVEQITKPATLLVDLNENSNAAADSEHHENDNIKRGGSSKLPAGSLSTPPKKGATRKNLKDASDLMRPSTTPSEVGSKISTAELSAEEPDRDGDMNDRPNTRSKMNADTTNKPDEQSQQHQQHNQQQKHGTDSVSNSIGVLMPTDYINNGHGTDVDSKQGFVNFQVLVREKHVTCVKLVLMNVRTGVKTHRVMDDMQVHPGIFETHTWRKAKIRMLLPISEEFTYQYIISSYEYSGFLVRTCNYFDLEESVSRHVPPSRITRDVFGDTSIKSQGTIVYATLMLQQVDVDGLEEALKILEDIGFPGHCQHINEVAEWINHSIPPYSSVSYSILSNEQIEYLAVLLGKLIAANRFVDKRNMTDNCLKFFIQTLMKTSAETFPTSVSKDVTTVCLWLANALHDSWLYAWVYFHRLLDIEALSNMKYLMSPLQWTTRTWDEDQQVLQQAIDTLNGSRPEVVDKIVIQCLQEISDAEVLKNVLLVYDAVINLKTGSDVSGWALNQLNNILQTKSKRFLLLYEIWQDMKSANLTELADHTRMYVVMYLKDEKWHQKDMKDALEAVTSADLYGTGTADDLTDVVKNMVKQNDDSIYEHFLKILSQKNILVCANEKNIQELLKVGIQSLVPQFKTRGKMEAIQLIYKTLALTRTSYHLTSYQLLIKNTDQIAYEKVKDISLDFFLKSLQKMGGESDMEVQIVGEHICRRLCEDKKGAGDSKKHLGELRGKDGNLKISTTPIRDVIRTMLEVQKLPANLVSDPADRNSLIKFETAIARVVSDHEFWLLVLTATGKYGDDIRQHPKCKAVVESLSVFSSALSSRNITVNFVRQTLRKHEEIVMKFLRVASSESTCTPSTQSLKKELECISIEDDIFHNRLTSLQQLFKCVDHLSCTVQVTNGRDLAKQIHDRQKAETNGKVTLHETTKPIWWGELHPLIPLADEMKGYVNSTVFLNICRSVVEGTCSDIHWPTVAKPDKGEGAQENDEDAKDDEKENSDEEKLHTVTPGLSLVLKRDPIHIVMLASVLTQVCIPTFRKHCEILLSAKVNVSTRIVQNMMYGVSDQERLDAELAEIKQIFGKPVPREMVEALKGFVKLPGLHQRSCILKAMFTTFGVDDSDEDDIQTAIQQISCLKDEQSMTLLQLQEALQTMTSIEVDFLSEDWEIIEQLATSQELVDLLGQLVDEDLRNLIDAVEDRSEQHVEESTVSDLIDVKGYVEALLRVQPPQQGKQLVDAVKQNRKLVSVAKGLPAKIESCTNNVHSLRDLYNNVANRGEMTKEIIYSALERGIYQFRLDEESGSCIVVLSYTRGISTQTADATYDLNQLNDLRSRALLIANTIREKANDEDPSPDLSRHPVPDYEQFITCVNTANDINDLCYWLRQSGHFSFSHFEEQVHTTQELEGLKASLKKKHDHWQALLKKARDCCYFLNFFHSKQLLLLDHFFQGKCSFSEDLALLFQYIDTTVPRGDSLRDAYQKPPNERDLEARLFHLGMALETIFSERLLSAGQQIPGDLKHSKSTLDTKVRKGAVFVAKLDEESTKTIPVLLRLYHNTTGVLPEPSQVIFCHDQTSWEEIELLLQRSTGASAHFKSDKLFVLANVELLPTETQFRLVTEVQRLQKTKQNDEEFLLALICRGSNYNHIIDQFSPNYTHCLQGFTDAEMDDCLQSGWPEVEVVTSSQPGLGKTEYIRDLACNKNLGVRNMPVGGPIIKRELVEQLNAQAGMRKEILHIDVSAISDPTLLDTFFFEIVVMGMAVSGTHMCLTPTENIIMEIANTQKDKLRNSLTTCSSFQRTHLEWKGFNSFIISTDVSSPVQVVCHYLKALKGGTLDKDDVVLTGPSCVIPIPATECRALLDDCFAGSKDLTHTVVTNFIKIFSQELRHMSASLYFTTSSLKAMLGEGSIDVRSKFVQALRDVSKDFTARSVKKQSLENQSNSSSVAASLQDYRSGDGVSASQMVARMQGMVKWTDSNHLLVVFHRQDSQTISTLYRLLSEVPPNIRKLFETQMNRELPDYDGMAQDELHNILEKVCRNARAPFEMNKLEALQENYALTPDNLLKMILIHMRINVRIPVIIMGETGCGKTTLVTYLARVCEVAFEILNLHAGILEQDIVDFVSSLQTLANNNLKQEVWGFLDEINTCDHLGLLNEIICHHSLKGKPLPNNLMFIAACNPYTLREGSVISAGLESKYRSDEMSKLVYRVHPLPETMMDFVWDYGSLDKKVEDAYIRRMLEANADTFVDLIVMSQEFMREVENTKYCVSLRDVHRCQHLDKWFNGMLKEKKVVRIKGDQVYVNRLSIRSMVLALAHCYHSRLTKAAHREAYRQKIANILRKATPKWDVKELDIERMIRKEQLNILDKMQLPHGIAKNEALRENVFVMLVSILNRIPVFVVGKPGCSKSLSMQLIRSNLRGADSRDIYFKTLPPVYVVSHQGSESSTSEGIIKVFDKAKNYKKHNPDVMPVVLLDEIGLAEVSSFNPLKVLHSQLEPTMGGFPPVAVVGISNWALDAAKMNRAIHLSRPDPTIDDLADTAKSIRDNSTKKRTGSNVAHLHTVSEEKLKRLAEAYCDYQVNQTYTNFHGLRDYYSLVKYIAIHSSKQIHRDRDTSVIIENGILRNFGGVKLAMADIMNSFMEKMEIIQQPSLRGGTLDLIKENLDDEHARHLMLITSGDSALNILEQTLKGRDHVTIFGSRFENDISEEYSYTTLSEIILCMERGVTLVLRDLENIYGSLYDMLNQNYSIVGRKRNCRVALGPYSNPMCQVHKQFRCIVLVDEQNVDYQNPPFLNRFEKQTLRFNDILTDYQMKTISYIRRWMDDICSVEGYQFTPKSMFLGLHNDTLPSLVYLRSNDNDLEHDITPEQLAQRCQQDLMKVACPDAVLRASKSKLAQKDHKGVEEFQQSYFELPLQNGLAEFVEDQMLSADGMIQHVSDSDNASAFMTSSRCTRTVIYTHSSIHVDFSEQLKGLVPVQIEKLNKFKSERQFADRIRHFWRQTTSEQLLVLQCVTSHDAANMLLAKNRIDQYRNEYLDELATGDEGSRVKHALIVVHIDRSGTEDLEKYPWQFNFLCGWQQFTLDTLEPTNPSLEDLLQGSVSEKLSDLVSLDKIIREQLLWCFSCIKYQNESRDVDSAMKLAADVAKSNGIVSCLKMQIQDYIQNSEKDQGSQSLDTYTGWQVDVASNPDLLYRCSTLGGALLEHIKQCVREPLGKTVILLEKSSAWTGSPLSEEVPEDTVAFWQTCFDDKAIFDIHATDTHEPRGPESCLVDCNFLDLKYPFFRRFHEKIESNKDWLLQRNHTVLDNNEEHVEFVVNQLADIMARTPELHHDEYIASHTEDYIHDLYNIVSSEFAPNMPCSMRIELVRWFLRQILHPIEYIHEDANRIVARQYVAIWMYKKLLAAEIQLVSIYKEVTGGDPKILLDCIQRMMNGVSIQTPDEDTDDSSDIAAYDDDDDTDAVHDEGGDDNTSPDANRDMEQNTATSDDESENQLNSAAEDYEDPPGGSLKPSKADDPAYEISPNQIKESRYDSIMKSDEPAEALLVTKVCKDILPTQQMLDGSTGITDWLRKANRVLLLAGQVSADSATLHFLRLCRDFIVMLSDHFNITEEQLVQLSDLAKDVDDPLSSKDVFKYILETVQTLREETVVESDFSVLDNFLTSYFGLCLEADLDSPLLPQIIETLCANPGELITGSRAVLLDIIRGDINNVVDNQEIEGSDRDTKDDKKSRSTSTQLITSGEKLDEKQFPNLAIVDNSLAKQETDCSLAVVCCDILQEVGFKYLTCDYIANVTSDDHDLWRVAKKSVEIVGDPTEVHGSLRFAAAAAFLRALIKATAELINVSNLNDFKVGQQYFVIVNTLNGLFKLDENARCQNGLSLPQIHLLKCFREMQPLTDLRRVCNELMEPVTNLKTIEWQKNLTTTRLGYSPLTYVDHYSDALIAIIEWQTQQNASKVNEFLAVARNSPPHRLAFLAAVANTFYYIQTTKGLKDVDKQQARSLFESSNGFSKLYRHVLERLLGLSDFYGILCLSESSPQEDIEIASVVVHLVSVIVSNADQNHEGNTAFMSYLAGTSIDSQTIPVSGKTSTVLKAPYTKKPAYVDCQCGLRVVASAASDLPSACTVCHRTCRTTDDSGKKEKEVKQQERNPPKLSGTTFKFTESVRNLSPIAYRTIDTLLHSCLLAGLSSGVITEEQHVTIMQKVVDDLPMLSDADAVQVESTASADLVQENEASQITPPDDEASQITPPDDEASQITPPDDEASQITPPDDEASQITPPDDEAPQITAPDDEAFQITPADGKASQITPPDDEASQFTPPDVQEYLTSHLKKNWDMLRDAARLNFENVTVFLHRIIHACQNEIVTHPCPKNGKDRDALENAFAEIIDFEVKEIPKCLIRQKRNCLIADGVDINCLESKLEELDTNQAYTSAEAAEIANCRDGVINTRVCCLFRRIQEASLDNFRSQLATMCQTSENKYPFLLLCLSKLEIIEYVRYLPALLKWNSVLVGRLSHVIKRDEAKKMKVDDFLSNERFHPNEKVKKAAEDDFMAFQKAWNLVRDGWSKLTGNIPDFNNVTSSSNITECVVDKKDKNCHFRRMIRTLRDIQNDFLMDALAIATFGHCPALIFLIKDAGVAGIQTVPLCAAGTSIIEFKWSDELLVFHDVSTEYGYGSVIKYKYTNIERELARILVLNKAYLTEDSTLTQFAYSDELFHACSTVLTEIGTIISQAKLPNDLTNTIKKGQKHRRTFAKDLLDHLEVILVLLKKTGGDPESSLDEFVKRWATQLPASFPDNLLPDPRDGVKLQHVVHLYETLEDLLVHATVVGLRDDFRSELPERSANQMGQKLKPKKLEQLEASASTLRRFIFRFLRSSSTTNTGSNLKELVVRSSEGTMDCSAFTDLLPDDLKVRHVVKILEYIDKQVEQRKDASRKKDIQQQPSRPRATASGGAGARRPRRGGVAGVS